LPANLVKITQTGFWLPLYPVGEWVGVSEGERWPVPFSNGKEPLEMDRGIYKLITYVAIGLAVAYLWVHRVSLVGQLQRGIQDWWK
jgi:hypothetical protein